MELKIDTNQLSEATKEALGIFELFKRAERSALKSTGFMVRTELRGYVETGGRGSWPELHPLTRLFWKKYEVKGGLKSYGRGDVIRPVHYKVAGAGGKMVNVSKNVQAKRANNIPMYWLGKHARYRVVGNEAVIGFGRSHGDGDRGSRRKVPGEINNDFLMRVVGRAERGEQTSVSNKTRLLFGGTRWDNEDDQVIGENIFPLRRSTTTLTTPKRPIIGPVLARVESKITPYFEDKFWLAVTRYREGVKNKI